MFKEDYRKLNDELTPSPELLARTLAQAQKHPRTVHRLRRSVAVAAALCCLLAAVPALAASLPAANDLLYRVSPELAQLFRPVQRSCISNGIELVVHSAYIHGDTAEIYLSLRDLEGDRVDATTDLFDSYSLRRPFDSSATCQFAGFDEESRTAFFLVQVTEWGNHKIEGEKLTFTLSQFLSEKEEQEGLSVPLDLGALPASVPTREAYSTGGGGEGFLSSDDSHMLLPADPPLVSPAAGIDITAAGYLNGKLHIQTAMHDNLKYDNHCSLYLMDRSGARYDCFYSRSFIDKTSGERVDYCEFVFDLPQETAADCTLYGDFVTSKRLTQGDWQVTFPLENAE